MSQLKIFHNPRCSKSRQTLEIILAKGVEPEIIKYLDTPPSATEILQLLEKLDVEVDGILRKTEAEYKQNFKDKVLSKSEKIDLMVKFPKVIERPIVFNDMQAIIGRPPENVLELL